MKIEIILYNFVELELAKRCQSLSAEFGFLKTSIGKDHQTGCSKDSRHVLARATRPMMQVSIMQEVRARLQEDRHLEDPSDLNFEFEALLLQQERRRQGLRALASHLFRFRLTRLPHFAERYLSIQDMKVTSSFSNVSVKLQVRAYSRKGSRTSEQ